MTAAAATTLAPKQSWRPLLWGLVLFLILPQLPFFELIVPIDQTLLLLIPVVTVCSIVGWKLGGRAALALIWLALSLWMLLQPAGVAGTPYDQMARGWAILLAASFGLVSLWSVATPFFTRALAAVGISTAVGFLLALAAPSGIARFQRAAGEELTRRVTSTIERIHQSMDTPEWKQLAEKLPGLDTWNDESESVMRAIPDQAASLLPALLAVESLAALALAWGLYQRFSPVKIGPQLSPLTEFRFNDQLIWGVAVGATLCLLPAFADGRTAGLNLLIFFGTLYLIRGLGVLAWIARGRYAVIIILSLIPQICIMLGVLALGLGLGDTWLDIRRRPRAA
ncbi:MAG: DUF2232 domain-containing protein [Gemmatimonadaceae bacterium]